MKTLAVRKDDLILRLSQRIGESIIMGFPLRSFIGNFYDTSIAKKRGEKKRKRKKKEFYQPFVLILIGFTEAIGLYSTD